MTKPDYKNWMPKGMVLGTLAGAVGCLGLAAVCGLPSAAAHHF